MKNTRDPFDDELRNRLDNYSEEPDDKLWSGIASNIDTVKPPFNWTKWLSVGSAIVVLTSAVLYFSLNETTEEEIAGAAKSSLVEEAVKQNDEAGSAKTKSEKLLSAEKEIADEEQAIIKEPITDEDATEQSSDQRDQQHIDVAVISKEEKTAETVQNISRKKTARNSPDQHAEASDNHELSAGSPRASLSPSSVTRSELPSNPSVSREQLSKGEDSESGTVERAVLAEKKISSEETSTQSEKTSLADLRSEEAAEKNSNGTAKVDDNNAKAKEPSLTVSSPVHEDTTLIDSLNNKSETKVAVALSKSVEEDKEEKKKANRKLSLYLTAMPTFGYQRIEANQNDNVFIESISKVSNFSTKRLGIRAEIGAEYALTPKFRVFGGVLYYQRKQTIDYVERVPVNEVVENTVDTVVVIQPDFTSQARTFEYELRNLGVQIGLNYVLKEKKFLHTIGTGIEFHKALNSLPEEHDALGFHSNPSTFVFANLYYRLQYPAQGRLRAVFQPTFNYSLYLNQDMNAPFFVKPYGLGLNVGLTYHF